MSVSRPISLTLAALGGQGGGVVSGWLTEVARREGYLVQATSVPGVAQRTGATIYYLEFFPEALLPGDGRRPVMALMPNPGDVDVVVASELVEAGRVMQRGLVTPGRTTLIASTHRSYTISEKSHGGDGRASGERILEDARASARRLLAFDMAAVATAQGAMISAVILGSIAGANVLPFRPDAYRETIRAGKVAVDLNLAGFDAGVAAARAASEESGRASAAAASPEGAARLPGVPTDLALRIDREIPEPARATARHGVARVVDYQDARHAGSYLEQLERFAALDREHGDGAARLTESVARGLALWMSFEDTIRVADLKTRIDRHERIRASVKARPAELVQVSEFVRPRVAEICGTLPASLGRRILESPRLAAAMARLTSGRRIRTDTVSGFMLLRLVAGLRRWRRGTLRFEQEMSRARSWLDAVARIAPRDYGLAVELAECQKLVRGYGDTHDRGWRNFERLVAAAHGLEGKAGSADALARLRRSALDSDADADADAGLLTASRGA
jgi:indolepyruvate ferredoxin oxidoreductase beta subunit